MELYLGQIILVGFNFAPRGTASCDGQLLAISQNQALFSLLGTIYGGDGRTTFALPDLRSRVPVHQGQGPGYTNRPIGSRGGQESTTLGVPNLPPHSHILKANASNATSSTPVAGQSLAAHGVADGRTFDPVNGYVSGDPTIDLNTKSIGLTGSGTSFNNMQPYLTMHYVIATQGIFPSRS
ncbi:MAG: phage tail protein [Cytophagaceae bacterium]|nr:phage tail protein [Cytophagaceae bacterium]